MIRLELSNVQDDVLGCEWMEVCSSTNLALMIPGNDC